MRKIAFINPPFASAYVPSIGLTQLRYVAQHEFGIPVSIFYLNMAVAETIGIDLYEEIANQYYIQGFGDWLFRSLAYPDMPDNQLDYLRWIYLSQNSSTQQKPGWGADLEHMMGVVQLRPAIYAVVERYIESHSLADYDIVGLTSMFSQNMASFSVARLVKERNPAVTVIMGGANCEDPMGSAISANVKWIDYVFSGPAISSFREFLRRWRPDTQCRPAMPVSGIFRRDGGQPGAQLPVIANERPVQRVGMRNDIDEPIALDYDDYLDQFDYYFPDHALRPSLLFETSRGCWWGERSQCTFCGLNGTAMNYDAMSPERAAVHITELFRYAGRARQLEGVDNILPRSFVTRVFPLLRTPPGLSLFFEVKVGLTDSDLVALARAGVRELQPGIESLATSTLRLMRKGSSAFQNLMMLRSMRAIGMAPEWLLLVGFPGEPEDVYPKYMRDLPLFTHLQPPKAVFPIRFDRYSAYFEAPEQYGLDLRPKKFYALVYPFGAESLGDLAYYFDDVTVKAEYRDTCLRYLQPMRAVVGRWKERWRCGERPQLRLMEKTRSPDGAVVLDSRDGQPVFRGVSGPGLALLDALQRPLTLARAAERTNLNVGRAHDEMLQLQAERLIFEERGRYLSLLVGPLDLRAPGAAPGGHGSTRRRTRPGTEAYPGDQAC